MVSVGKWETRARSNHRTVHRARFKRKPQLVQKNNQEINNWSSWKVKNGISKLKTNQKETWKPLTKLNKHESETQKALNDIHEEIEKQNFKPSDQKENWESSTHYEKQPREARLKDNQMIKGISYRKQKTNTKQVDEKPQKEPKIQKFRIGSEGKILTIKGAQISIFPPKKRNKTNSRKFFL